MRLTGRAADVAAEGLRNLRFAGQTEAQVANAVIALGQQAGLDQASCILASGPNSASPHHSPGDKVITEGEAVWMDFGGLIGNYKSDVTRSVFVGTPPAEYVKVYDVVRRAQETAARTIRTGMACQDLDRIARKIITDAGYGQYFIHRTGHGIGLETHEPPFLVEGNLEPLQAGMVFTVEPGIYLPGVGGVRIEDDVLVTAEGSETLSSLPRGLVSLLPARCPGGRTDAGDGHDGLDRTDSPAHGGDRLLREKARRDRPGRDGAAQADCLQPRRAETA